MALSQPDIEILAQRLLDGSITEDELHILNKWINEQVSKDTYEIHDDSNLQEGQLRSRLLDKILSNIAQSSEVEKKNEHKNPFLWGYWSKVAAVILLIGSVAYILFQYYGQSSYLNFSDPSHRISFEEVTPVHGEVMLTLPSGDTVYLSQDEQGVKVVNNALAYLNGEPAIADFEGPKERSVQRLSLSTSTGRTYALVLSDGTKVWLNANSSISYPMVFEGQERRVKITGEAYFEVAKNKQKPFFVETERQEVKVLGTQFNVSSYPDNDDFITTLVEGSVRLLDRANPRYSVTLKPGEQAITTADRTTTKTVDPFLFTAWKDGYFFFENSSPKEAFNQLSQWYDIDVQYKNGHPKVAFFGMIKRDKSLGSILKIFEKSGVSFALHEKNNRKILTVISE